MNIQTMQTTASEQLLADLHTQKNALLADTYITTGDKTRALSTVADAIRKLQHQVQQSGELEERVRNEVLTKLLARAVRKGKMVHIPVEDVEGLL